MSIKPLLTVISLVPMLLSLSALEARANWTIGRVTNGTNQPVTFSFPMGGGSGDVRAAAGVRGDAILYIPAAGPLIFKDIGHDSPCSRPYWAVRVTYGTQNWKFYYDGNGIVDVSITAAGAVSLTPGTGSAQSSQVTAGNASPRCSAR